MSVKAHRDLATSAASPPETISKGQFQSKAEEEEMIKRRPAQGEDREKLGRGWEVIMETAPNPILKTILSICNSPLKNKNSWHILNTMARHCPRHFTLPIQLILQLLYCPSNREVN